MKKDKIFFYSILTTDKKSICYDNFIISLLEEKTKNFYLVKILPIIPVLFLLLAFVWQASVKFR